MAVTYLKGGSSELLWNDEPMALVKSYRATVTVNKTTEEACGSTFTASVPHNCTGKGSMTIYRTIGGLPQQYARSLIRGEFPALTLTDSIHADDGSDERHQLTDVVLDEVSLADFTAGQTQTMDISFTFGGVIYL